MPRGLRLSDEEKGMIIAYKDSGMSFSEISRKIGRTRCVIANFLRSPENYGKARRTGRKPKLSKRDKRRILNQASNSTTSCRQLAALASKPVSATTVWRTLHMSDHIVSATMKKAPTLKPHHKEARVKFASNNLDTCWDMVSC